MALTTTQISTLVSLTSSTIKQVKESKTNWTSKTPLVIAIATLVILASVCSMLYAFFTSNALPMLVVLNCSMIVLPIGMYQQSRTINTANTEYMEYNTQVMEFLELFDDDTYNAELHQIIHETIAKVKSESDDVQVSLDVDTLTDAEWTAAQEDISGLGMATSAEDAVTSVKEVVETVAEKLVVEDLTVVA